MQRRDFFKTGLIGLSLPSLSFGKSDIEIKRFGGWGAEGISKFASEPPPLPQEIIYGTIKKHNRYFWNNFIRNIYLFCNFIDHSFWNIF